MNSGNCYFFIINELEKRIQMGQPLLTESTDLKKPVLLALLIEYYF